MGYSEGYMSLDNILTCCGLHYVRCGSLSFGLGRQMENLTECNNQRLSSTKFGLFPLPIRDENNSDRAKTAPYKLCCPRKQRDLVICPGHKNQPPRESIPRLFPPIKFPNPQMSTQIRQVGTYFLQWCLMYIPGTTWTPCALGNKAHQLMQQRHNCHTSCGGIYILIPGHCFGLS